MTPMESKVWAATFAASYVAEMDLGRRRGMEPTPDACAGFALSAIDIADSAVHALKRKAVRDESEYVGEED
jgi:hypothetical protein